MAQSEDYYNRLLRLRREEMQAKVPVPLPADFYEATRRYLGELETLLAEELRKDPTSARAEATRQARAGVLSAVRSLLEWRLEKIGRRSILAALQGDEWMNLLPEERALAEGLRDEIASFTRRFAPFLLPPSTASDPPAGGTAASRNEAAPATPSPGPATGGPGPPSPPRPAADPPELVVVRILQDGAPIMAGPEDAVDLHAEDLLTLPEGKAQLLVRSGVAQRLDVRRPAPEAAPP